MQTKLKLIVNYLNKKLQLIKLFKDYLAQVKLKEYRSWQMSDDKLLKHHLIEWLFNEPFKYLFIGMLLMLGSFDMFILKWICLSTVIWLLFRVVVLIKRGE